MNEKIEALRRLQSIYTKLKRLEGDKLYRNYDVQKKQNQIQQKKSNLTKLGDEIKVFQKNAGVKEVELKSREADIVKLRVQMNQVKNNKEYSAIKNEIAGKETDKSVLEDEILRTMSGYEEMQQRFKSLEKEIEREESQLEEIQKKVDVDVEVMDAEIAELKKKHSEYAYMVDSDTLQHYNRLAGHKDALAVVGVVNRVCQGCFMSITSQTLNKLLSDREITCCHSCGRILYLDDNKE